MIPGAVLAEWVARLVRVPSVNPEHAGPRAEAAGPVGEAQLAATAAGWLEDLGATVTLDEREPGRTNLYALVPGRTDRLVALDVHLDTVSVEHMTSDPFDGRVVDGRVWGRGSCDTKASLGVVLAVLEAMRAEGRRPGPSLLVVGTASEEAGGLKGATWFREWADGEGLRIDELMVAEPTDCVPVHGHKGGFGLAVTVRGTAAHSSRPELGANAVEAAAPVVLAVAAEQERLAATEADTPVGVGTVSTTMIDGGLARNVIPDRCTLSVGRRIAPGEDPDAEAERLSALIRDACPLPVDIELVNGRTSAAFYQPADSPWLGRLAEWTGRTPVTATFGSNTLRYDGLAGEMVVLGPGSIEVAHQAEEYVPVDELVTMAGVYGRWLA